MLGGDDSPRYAMPVLPYGRIKALAAVFLLVALALLVLTGALFFADWWEYGGARTMSQRRHDVWNATVGLRAAVKDAETGQRGYLLTGDPRYLRALLNGSG